MDPGYDNALRKERVNELRLDELERMSTSRKEDEIRR